MTEAQSCPNDKTQYQPCPPVLFFWCALITISLTTLLSGCNTPKPFNGEPVQLDVSYGQWQTLQPENITAIYGIGLSYAEHIVETGRTWDPDTPAPVFKKSLNSLNTGQTIVYPDRASFLTMAETVEPGLARVLEEHFPYINPLLDYEVELGMVLLEPFDRSRINDSNYLPRLGFVLAADITARSFMVLGEDKPNQSEYWGAAKSFPGFSVVGSKMWIPSAFSNETVVNVSLETWVNGKQRQNGNSSDRVYSAKEMIEFIAAQYPGDPLHAGTVIMTGTPPGVAFRVPGWKRALAKMLGLDRFTLLGMVIEANDNNPDFLMPGDIIGFNVGQYDSLNYKVVGQSAAEEITGSTGSN